MPDHAVAVVGMACRFPGARDVEEFWRNLRAGTESVSFFKDEELRAAGVGPELLARTDYVRANAVVAEADGFDAGFFGYTPREAELIDPQQRVFLECAWTAMEHAGFDPSGVQGAVGVFAGAGPCTYLLRQLAPDPVRVSGADGFAAMIANDKDFLATRVAYKLNLRGPAIAVQSACSTSLVAVHLALQSLLAGECDLAMAGGVSIRFPQTAGYVHQEGMILSPDGHCRAFDARAEGIVGGNGAGVVVLRRLASALEAGDTIHAVIRGSAVNNDGAEKVGYTAPSVAGQEAVIAEALAMAGVSPDTIGYVEAHGTGTALGDPIEVGALTRAFRRGTDRRQFCALGSVKTNIGHLDTAAGIAGLIKAVLVLSRREIPPSLHFAAPNPQIDFASSPFRVANGLEAWPAGRHPRRAGVSSFGLGGTNAHVVLEEAPAVAEELPRAAAPAQHLLVVSARSGTALKAAATNLAAHLRANSHSNIADIAWTLATGRHVFSHRHWAVASTVGEASEALAAQTGLDAVAGGAAGVVFLFPGQGTQYPGMAAGLYRSAPVFRAEVDRCAELLRPHLGGDVRELLFAPTTEAARLARPAAAQIALFTTEYSLARQWMAWGVRPSAMIGHSIGEWVAACLGGVFTVEEALRLVAARGRLMEAQPPGAMLAVQRSEAEVRPFLGGGIALAAVNAPDQTVLSGPVEAISDAERTLAARGIPAVRLPTLHAYHSAMMEPAARALEAEFAAVPRRVPQLRWISNVTGAWIEDLEAGSPAYWARHLLETVRFADGMAVALKGGATVLLEVGPGRTLGGLAARQAGWTAGHRAISSVRHSREAVADEALLLRAAGRLWSAGVALDWNAMRGDTPRRRVTLPTYPFERQRHWIEAPADAGRPSSGAARSEKRGDLADWFYLPSWKRALMPASLPAETDGAWLIVADAGGLATRLAERLTGGGAAVEVVAPGADAAARLSEMAGTSRAPRWIISLRDVTQLGAEPAYAELMALLKTLAGAVMPSGARLTIVANGLQAFAGEQPLQPAKAMLRGPIRVLPREVHGFAARIVDVVLPAPGAQSDGLAERLLAEARADEGFQFVALRGRDRWVQTLVPERLGPAARLPLRERGVYLISGGLGGIGLVLAAELAKRVHARLVLFGRAAPGAQAQARIDQFNAAGAEVLTATVDVIDEPALQRLREEILRRWGRIDGVIHAAGVTGAGALALRAPEAGSAVLAPKVAGALALDRTFARDPLDFFVLMSSLTAQLGEFGQADYAAANAFLDAFAEARHAEGAPMMSIAWDAWRDNGMAARAARTAGLAEWEAQQRPLRISDEEGAEIFCRAIAAGAAHLVVSTRELGERMRAAADLGEPSGDLGPAAFSRPPRKMQARPTLATPYVTPSTATERAVATLFADLLGIAPVGANDNFFDLGGHSLLATQAIARLRETHGAALTLPAFFTAPTAALLAEAIDAPAADGETGPPLKPALRSGQLPLSYQQQALWLLDRLSGQNSYMNELGAQTVLGQLNGPVLKGCFGAVVRRHEALRTRFVEHAGAPMQEILPELEIDLPVVDVSDRTEAAQEAEVQRLAAEMVATPFDLTRPPLMRALLVRRGAEHHVVIAVVHHIVFDGWSAGVFFREMLAFYDASARGTEPAVPALPLQYADYAVWQRAYLQGERRAALEAFWRNRLGGRLPVLALPTDRPRPPKASFRGERLTLTLDDRRTRSLEELGRAHGASLFMTLLAAYGALLGRYAGQDEVIVGCPSAGRDRREIEPLIGFFVNPLPMRLDLRGDPSFAALLARVYETVLAAQANQALPFELIVEAVRPPRDASRHDLFQALFVFQNDVSPPPGASRLAMTPLEFRFGPARSDLDLYLWKTADGLRGHFLFNTALFDTQTVARLAQRWQALIEAILTDPARPLGALGFGRPEALPMFPGLARGPSGTSISAG